jgi:hypothetical protein
MHERKRFLSLLIIAVLAGCGGGGSADESSNSGNDARPPSETAAGGDETDATIDGSVSFRIDETEIALDFLPADESYYGKLSSAVVARRGRGEPEQLVVTFLGTNLREHAIPGEFPPEGAGTSISTAMQSVGFSYTDPNDDEWAGPGRIYVESFSDAGVLTATFDAVTLPHTDDERPDITLSGGRLRAALR